ncbi:MAG: protein-disulfide reductase DsbD [Gammaproteobacteria bacterium]
MKCGKRLNLSLLNETFARFSLIKLQKADQCADVLLIPLEQLSHMQQTVNKPRLAWLPAFALMVLAVALLFSGKTPADPSRQTLLPPDQAYQLSAESVASDTLFVEWKIADGYYLYKDKIKFESGTPGVSFGEVEFPTGKIKEDEFFGKSEIYRNRISLNIPVLYSSGQNMSEIRLVATSQGCADIGVCYPPHTQSRNISLPDGTIRTGQDAGFFNSLSSFGSRFGFNTPSQTFLEPDKAFIFTAEIRDENTLLARWHIADGYYLYREKFSFNLQDDSHGITLGEPVSPKGKTKEDESFGVMEVYYDQAEILIPVQRSGSDPTPVVLEAGYQGCADDGFCYPPMKQSIDLIIPAASATPLSNSPGTSSPTFIPESDRIAQTLADGISLSTMLWFFGAGLLLAFTPCVLPMVPILSSLIIGQGNQVTTRKAFLLSLFYVLAMVITYTVAGVLAGLFGSNLQTLFQSTWIIASFSMLFVILSLSMFGFYELQIPASIQTKLNALSNKQEGGTVIGATIMGFLSALIVGPCIAAPLAGALIYIGISGDALGGGLSLFGLSLGMGTPLLAVGVSAGKLLPKAGAWMNNVKTIFGVMLLGLAIWMLERIIPEQAAMLLWGALLIGSAVFMGAFSSMALDSTGWDKLWKGVGLIFLIYGGLILVGAASGGHDIFQPLKGTSFFTGHGANNQGPSTSLVFKPTKGLQGFKEAIRTATAEQKPVMLDFYADWCIECKRMERNTFSDPGVKNVLANVILLQADVTKNDELDQALLKHFGLFGPPAILFFDQHGNEVRNYRLIGFRDAEEFEQLARNALSSS